MDEQREEMSLQEQPANTEELNKTITRREKGVKSYQRFILHLLVFLATIWLLFFVFIGVTRMPGTDMYPRLDNGDMMMFYRLDKTPKAQDVIVLKKANPDSEKGRMYVCRVVAVSGDTVEITEDEKLIINGKTMIEPNIFSSTPRIEGSGFPTYPLTLGEGECFVLADSRRDGVDSRYFGPVSKDEILGTVITFFRRNNL